MLLKSFLRVKHKLPRLIQILGFCLLGYILIICGQLLVGFLRTTEGQLSKIAIAMLLIVLFIIIPFGFALTYWYAKIKAKRTALMLAIVCLGSLLRLTWVLAFPTPPISDFLVNHQIALTLSRSEFQPSYDRSIGYPVFLAMAYEIYPDALAGRLLNVLLGTLSIWLVYQIGCKLNWPIAGFAAAFILAVLPNEIMLSSTLCTEIGGTTFVLAAALSLLSIQAAKKPLWATILAGVMLGLGVLFRPNIIILTPLIFILLWNVAREQTWKRYAVPGIYIVGVLMPMLMVAGWHSLASGYWSLGPLNNKTAAYTLLSGTNFETKGIFSHEETVMYWSWPEEQRLQKTLQISASRIMENPVGFASLVGVKLQRLVSEAAYGEDWALNGISGSPLWVPLYRWTNGLPVWAQSFYMVVLILAGFFLGTHSSHRIGLRFSLIASLMLVISPHILLETQARYQHILLPFLVIAAGCGMAMINERWPELPLKRKDTRERQD